MEKKWQEENVILRIRWLLLLLTTGLVFLYLGEVKSALKYESELILLAAAAYVYATISFFLLYKIPHYIYAYFTWSCELILVTFLIYFTGISYSPFVYLYFYLVLVLSIGKSPGVAIGGGVLTFIVYSLLFVLDAVSNTKISWSNFASYSIALLCFAFIASLSQVWMELNQEDKTRARDRELEDSYKISRKLAISQEQKELELADKTRKITALMEIARYMNNIQNMQHLLEVIVQEARREMNSAISFITIVKNEELQIVHSYGLSEISKEILNGRLNEGMLSDILKTNKPIKFASNDPQLKNFSGTLEHIRNFLCVPLQSPDNNAAFGLLAVANILVGEGFSEEQEDYLRILAADASVSYNNITLHYERERSYMEVIQALAQAVEARDPYTHDHVSRVRWLALRLGERLRLSRDEMELLAKAAILHDVGKIATPDQILLKTGSLTNEEFEIMKNHAAASFSILKDISSIPPKVLNLVLHHHERYDGKGYPEGLQGEAIPLGAQVIAVADTFDAMTSDRPYRKGFDPQEAIDRIRGCGGTQFNPKVLNAFIKLFEEELIHTWKKT